MAVIGKNILIQNYMHEVKLKKIIFEIILGFLVLYLLYRNFKEAIGLYQ